MATNIEGLEAITKRLDNLADAKQIEQGMGLCCAAVERTAKQKAQAIKDTGNLSISIASRVENVGGEIRGVVYTPLEYAPYVEYGTGLFAEKGGTSDVPWVFVKDGSSRGSKGEKKPRKSYTLATAKRTVAYLRKQGLDAYYTFGQKPQPYLRPALTENRDKILRLLKGSVNND